jgi:hypothetical protein
MTETDGRAKRYLELLSQRIRLDKCSASFAEVRRRLDKMIVFGSWSRECGRGYVLCILM